MLSDADVFGVQLEDGRIAYCCVMGGSGRHTGLGVYVGDRGFKTYLDTIDDGTHAFSSETYFASIAALILSPTLWACSNY